MIDGRKVVAWTPYGRKETMTILTKYMVRDHEAGVVDEYWLYMNTDPDQVEDVAYAHELAEEYPWIKLKSRPDRQPLHPKQLNTGFFYLHAIEPDTIYVRLDDDIVYVHEDAMERLASSKIASPWATAHFPIIWHNAICSYWLQKMGKIPESYGIVQSPYCMDPVGWGNAWFAEQIHRQLLGHIREGSVEEMFLHHDIQLPIGLQFSVSCFASNGSMYASLPAGPGNLSYNEEESWHTIHEPRARNIPNMIIGNALVSHLSFYPHTNYIRRETDILDQYREISESM